MELCGNPKKKKYPVIARVLKTVLNLLNTGAGETMFVMQTSVNRSGNLASFCFITLTSNSQRSRLSLRLFFDHANNFQLQAGVEFLALLCHVMLLRWWISTY